MLRRASALPFAVLVAASATGWLYLVRPQLPGPRIGEALPLDELSRHAAAPIVWYVLVWLVAGAILGLVVRRAGADRLTAARRARRRVGLFEYLESGVSISVVRQVSMRSALDAADTLKPVYLSAMTTAIAIAAIASPRARARRAPLLVATAVAAGGALNLFHAMLPGEDTGLLRVDDAGCSRPARPRRRHAARRRAARRLAGPRTPPSAFVAGRAHARRALDVPPRAARLQPRHARLGRARRPARPPPRLRRAGRRGDEAPARHPIRPRGRRDRRVRRGRAVAEPHRRRPALHRELRAREIGRGLLGLDLHGSPHLAGRFGEWYPLSLLLLGLAAVAWVLAGWLAPWRHRVAQLEREREIARSLVHAWGADTLAPFVLRRDKSYFFAEDESAFVAYRVIGGVAIVSGDPVGPRHLGDELVARFVAYARARDWRVAILGASERWLGVYADHGLHSLYHGDEAIVDTAAFSLEGRPIRKVRQSVHRLDNAGFTTRVLSPSAIDSPLRLELEAVADEWRGDQPERGFVMALDALFGLDDEDAVFVVGFDPDGTAAGFLHFAISPAGRALSLSSMPRHRDTPNGFNEWLICAAIGWARAHGFEQVSLNFAPFAALLAPEADLTAMQEMQRRALLRLKGHFQLDNLLAFNRKFLPRWEPRFVVYERRRDLPRVGIAALAAEAYLPFRGERR